MKRVLFSLFALLMLNGYSNAQNLFFDASLPNQGFGIRATAFQSIDPMLDAGMTLRVHRMTLDAPEAEGGTEEITEGSIGLGLKFYAFRDATGNNAFYINPNAELATTGSDRGMDMSINFGYTKMLTQALGVNLELGARGRVMGYQTQLATQNRFTSYIGAGLNFNLSEIFSTPGAGDPILTQ